VTRPSPWLAAAASVLVHAGLGWRLYTAPPAVSVERERDTFQVRRVVLPPPPPAILPEPPAPVPEPPAPPPPRPRPTPARPAADPAPARLEPAPEPAPERVSAPPALLADTGPAAVGGVVQLPGASIGALVTTKPLLAAPPRGVAAPAAALAKLSDLSRKPHAPSLDAALRQNYPAALRRRGTEGQAEVRVVIDARGRVGDVAILSESAAGFAEACRKTLLGSRWSEPLDRDGNAVSTRLTYRCRFQIER